ncbi:MAG: hypothetical protein KatS3mg002_0978 [Candidatus Woesearchaeota archaeon]|nr:MAG: hypothetical protein KatS3mg002_0978 [Candidatus Woesearchaeota archaeon]
MNDITPIQIDYPNFDEKKFLLYFGDNLLEGLNFYQKKYNQQPEKVYFDPNKKLIVFISKEIDNQIDRR